MAADTISTHGMASPLVIGTQSRSTKTSRIEDKAHN